MTLSSGFSPLYCVNNVVPFYYFNCEKVVQKNMDISKKKIEKTVEL